MPGPNLKYMVIENWLGLFQQQLAQTSAIEWIAVCFGVAEVLLAKRNKIWLYPAGIISVVLSMYLLLNVKLYAETVLNLYYLVMSIYGWMAWNKKGSIRITSITWSTRRELRTAVAITTFGLGLVYLLLKYYTDSDVPLWDAFIASTAWAGMWLLTRRKVENWVFLNISNFFAIPILIHKELFVFALLTVFLFGVAISGYFDWRKKAQKLKISKNSSTSIT